MISLREVGGVIATLVSDAICSILRAMVYSVTTQLPNRQFRSAHFQRRYRLKFLLLSGGGEVLAGGGGELFGGGAALLDGGGATFLDGGA